MYVVIWQYVVAPERAAAFERAYGTDGEWVALFRRADGYVDTQLHRHEKDASCYLTIDRWNNSEHYEAFRRDHALEYSAIDTACGTLTLEERLIGAYTRI
jgi:heme-degrading monooxygenase HmoA